MAKLTLEQWIDLYALRFGSVQSDPQPGEQEFLLDMRNGLMNTGEVKYSSSMLCLLRIQRELQKRHEEETARQTSR